MGRISTATPVTVQAYAVVPNQEQQPHERTFDYNNDNRRRTNNTINNETYPVAVTATVASLNHHHHHRNDAVAYVQTVQPDVVHSIPEANGLCWIDTYFDEYNEHIQNDEIIAVFDLDYKEIESYYTKLSWCIYGTTFLCGGIFWTGVVLGVPCFINPNVQWYARCQHIAITRTGIVYVTEKRPCCWGLSCTDIGERIVTIPFDTIRDCKVIEATGTTCLWIDNTLHNVTVQTKSSANMLNLEGLKNPEGFRRLVLAMKRIYYNGITSSTVAAETAFAARVAQVMERADNNLVTLNSNNTNNNGGNGDVPTLLREIRDELRQHNEMLQTLRTTGSASSAVVPQAPQQQSSSSSVVGLNHSTQSVATATTSASAAAVVPTAPIEEPTTTKTLRDFV